MHEVLHNLRKLLIIILMMIMVVVMIVAFCIFIALRNRSYLNLLKTKIKQTFASTANKQKYLKFMLFSKYKVSMDL